MKFESQKFKVMVVLTRGDVLEVNALLNQDTRDDMRKNG